MPSTRTAKKGAVKHHPTEGDCLVRAVAYSSHGQKSQQHQAQPTQCGPHSVSSPATTTPSLLACCAGQQHLSLRWAQNRCCLTCVQPEGVTHWHVCQQTYISCKSRMQHALLNPTTPGAAIIRAPGSRGCAAWTAQPRGGVAVLLLHACRELSCAV